VGGPVVIPSGNATLARSRGIPLCKLKGNFLGIPRLGSG
jgi:hypothetical protein